MIAEDLAAGRAAPGVGRRGRAPSTGYSRERFGQAWADVDRNGCDTRNDVLRRDLSATEEEDCTVLSGTLDEPYTASREVRPRTRIGRGADRPRRRAGGRLGERRPGVDRRKREAFANDPANLLAVDGPANQEKGASDAATWLPPQRGYRCVYALRQVRVKAAYGLWVTAAERDALNRELNRCVVATVSPP